MYSANQEITTVAKTSMISKNSTTGTSVCGRGASVALARLGLIGAGQVILTSTSWMPAPEGCTTASPLPAADSARSVQEVELEAAYYAQRQRPAAG